MSGPEPGRIVIVGASLAGLRAAEALRGEGFAGELTIIGEEADPPYDRPPLSKQVLSGWVPAQHTLLPELGPLGDVRWLLNTRATGLDLTARQVRIAGADPVPYDRLLIATGMRNTPWPKREQAWKKGVFGIRTRMDAFLLSDRLDRDVSRVVVIGAGFTGSEVASACRRRGIDVTVIERGEGPLAGALGGPVSEIAAGLHRRSGVDLRCGISVEDLDIVNGELHAVALSDGTSVPADVAVVALGGTRNVDWLEGSGLACGPLGVAADAGCRAIAANGMATDDVFVAGDVARFSHPLFGYQFLALEHWENAVVGAQVAAHNMVCPPAQRRPHACVPTFWSTQFDVNIKSVGVPGLADEVIFTQGSPDDACFAAAYGDHQGRIVAAVTFNHGRWLDHYRQLIEQASPLPGPIDDHLPDKPAPARIPHPGGVYDGPTVVVTGHSPTQMSAVVPGRSIR